jgi:hypothetical protein
MRDVVDLFGRSRHDAIAITDHVVNTDTLIGKTAHRLKLSVTREGFDAYMAEIEREARRAWDQYRMIVLPGVELTRNAATGGRSAHALALGLSDFVSADGPMEEVLTRAREKRAITVACHPNEQSGWFANTFYLWNRKNEVAQLLDLWEIACRWDLFPPVAREGFHFMGNSDFHQPKHLYTWKTLVDSERTPEAVLKALRSGKGLGLTRLSAPHRSPEEEASADLGDCPCLPAFSAA